MEKLKSRKLWATILATILTAAGPQFGITVPDEVIYLIMTYIGGQAAVDAMAAR